MIARTESYAMTVSEHSLRNAVSPWTEMRSWETLWSLNNQSQTTIAALFQAYKTSLPSETLERARAEQLFDIDDLEEAVEAFLRALGVAFSVCIHGTYSYPQRLREARIPIELFYYRGDIGLIESRCLSIVGARKCSPDGAARAARLAKELSAAGYTIVSGLAEGIDTAAMASTIVAGGHTVGVIGTPIDRAFPKENATLQEAVASNHLLISHVPFYRYAHEIWKNHRVYFPQRNEIMASLSAATIIVEASETSGTHTQARACMKQGRKLFILNSCFESGLKWPHTYESQGAIRVREMGDILRALEIDGEQPAQSGMEEV